jgi:hypothetical protein
MVRGVRSLVHVAGAVAMTVALDDVAAVAVIAGCIGGCVLLGLETGWYAGAGLFCLLLVAWGLQHLLLAQRPVDDLAAERRHLEA